MMKKLLILIILTQIVFSCDPQCQTCSSYSPYGCTSCYPNPVKNLYIKSCQAIQKSTLFTALGIVMMIVHLIMIFLGYGVYRNVYEDIQLISLISWGYGAQNGAQRLTITNFGFNQNNQFLPSYGPQFFLAITIIGIFIILVSAVDRLPHNSMATLIKRKKIIFPLRIQSSMFNMITFTALAQVCTINEDITINVLQIIISVLALTKQAIFLVIVFYLSNCKNFQIDDQNYYILIEKLSTCRWYARNNFLFSLLFRALSFVFFVTFYQKPQIGGLLVFVMMILYTVISAIGMRYIKARYWIFNFFGNLLTCACLFCMYGCGVQTIGSEKWQIYRKAYYILILMLCSSFLIMNFLEIIANGSQICKQLRSIYHRFIICQKMDDAVELNKYDSDKYRQKVISFRKNLIYGKNLTDRQEINQTQLS